MSYSTLELEGASTAGTSLCALAARLRARGLMDFDQLPPDKAPAEQAAPAGSSMQMSTAEPPAHGAVFAVPRTPFALSLIHI